MLFVTHSIITPHPRPLTLLVCRLKGCKRKKGAYTILKANNLDAHILLWKNWNVTWILSQIWFVFQNSFWTSFFLIRFSWMWLPCWALEFMTRPGRCVMMDDDSLWDLLIRWSDSILRIPMLLSHCFDKAGSLLYDTSSFLTPLPSRICDFMSGENVKLLDN